MERRKNRWHRFSAEFRDQELFERLSVPALVYLVYNTFLFLSDFFFTKLMFSLYTKSSCFFLQVGLYTGKMVGIFLSNLVPLPIKISENVLRIWASCTKVTPKPKCMFTRLFQSLRFKTVNHSFREQVEFGKSNLKNNKSPKLGWLGITLHWVR